MSAAAQLYTLRLREAPGGIALLPSERHVLMVIAFHYNDIEGFARPSIEELCEETGISEPRMHEIIRNLINKGLLEREGKGGRRLANRYRLPGLNGMPDHTLSDQNGTVEHTLSDQNGTVEHTLSENSMPSNTVPVAVDEQKGMVGHTRKSIRERVPSTSPSPSLPVLSEKELPETTTAPKGATPTVKAPRTEKPKAQEPPDLIAVTALWQSLGLGPVSMTGKTGLRKLIGEHGREWVEHGVRQASAQNIQWPVSWITTCIPAWKREREGAPNAAEHRNGTTPTARASPGVPAKPNPFAFLDDS